MTYGHTQVRDVGGAGGTVVHRQGCDSLPESKKTDTLPGLQSRTYHGIYDGTYTADAWDRA